MFFRNLCLHRLPAGWDIAAADLEAQLEARPLQPCGPFDMLTRGWVPVGPTSRLLHTVGNHQLIALGVEQKLLPASVIRQVTTERAAELAVQQGFPVGRKQMRDLKLRVADELRPRAFSRRRITHAWLDRASGWLVVDAASAGRAEELAETLRDTLGSFATTLPDTVRSPRAAMGAWLAAGEATGPFTIDEDVELQAADGSRAAIRYTRHAPDQAEVRRYLSGGFVVTRLGLTWNGRVSFVLDDKLQVRRVQFLELDKSSDGGQDVDPLEQFDIDFAVMSGELSNLVGDLVGALGGEAGVGAERAAAA
jgi:recombination associated protein RdgC